MTSIIKVDTLQDTGGNTILSSDGAGKVLTSKVNYPAFEAYLSVSQSLSDATNTKIQYDTEVFDTNSCYDNTTNYRFTPTIAGKYYVYLQNTDFSATVSNLVTVYNMIYKNGSLYKSISFSFANNYARRASPFVSAIIDMNGTTDYVEGFAHIDLSTSTPTVEANTQSTYFGAYRIGD